MLQKKRPRTRLLRVSYVYPDGFEEGIGAVYKVGDTWEVRYDFLDPEKPRQVEELTQCTEESGAALLLYERWWDERRKFDAEAVLLARQRTAELFDRAVRSVIPYAVFDAIKDNVVRRSHAALDNGIAPVEWWQRARKRLDTTTGFRVSLSIVGAQL